MKIYEVGGCIRDKLLGKTPSDFDYVVVGSSLAEMTSLGFKQVGKNFPVFLKDGQEYALARKEIKTGNKHSDFKFIFTPDITLAEDLERRDFTCNALAYDSKKDEIIDYHNGISDINNKILRHVNSEHFPEDPLRVLRMCRFSAQLDFDIAPETMLLAQNMVKQNMLSHLSSERIWQEIFKALNTSHFNRFITSMRQCGALKVIMPEVDEIFSFSENTASILQAINSVTKSSPKVKFATLLLKLNFPEKTAQLCKRLKVPNDFKDFAKISCQYHGYFYHILKLPINDLYQTIAALSKYNTDDLINVFRADYFEGLSEKDPQIQKDKETFFKKATKIYKSIKASDMPNFAQLSKNADFKEKLRDYKIQILQERLFFPSSHERLPSQSSHER